MSFVHHQIADVLRDAGDEGVEERVIIELAGRYWEERLEEMSRHGYTVAREHGRVYLIAERTAGSVERDRDPALLGQESDSLDPLSPVTAPLGAPRPGTQHLGDDGTPPDGQVRRETAAVVPQDSLFEAPKAKTASAIYGDQEAA